MPTLLVGTLRGHRKEGQWLCYISFKTTALLFFIFFYLDHSQTGLCLAPAFDNTWSRGELWVRAATSRGTRPWSLTRFTPLSLSFTQSFSFLSFLSHMLPPPPMPQLMWSMDSRLWTASVSSFSTASHRLLYYKEASKKMWCHERENTLKNKKNGHINGGIVLKAFFSWGTKGIRCTKNQI